MELDDLGYWNIVIMVWYRRSFGTQIKRTVYMRVVNLWRWSIREVLLYVCGVYVCVGGGRGWGRTMLVLVSPWRVSIDLGRDKLQRPTYY